jgi:hypothetical protein
MLLDRLEAACGGQLLQQVGHQGWKADGGWLDDGANTSALIPPVPLLCPAKATYSGFTTVELAP